MHQSSNDQYLILITPAQNLFPVQIENVLTAHPAIHEAAAVAVPDERYGEVVGAWTVREPTALSTLTREDVRALVADNMNPQVPLPADILGECEADFRYCTC